MIAPNVHYIVLCDGQLPKARKVILQNSQNLFKENGRYLWKYCKRVGAHTGLTGAWWAGSGLWRHKLGLTFIIMCNLNTWNPNLTSLLIITFGDGPTQSQSYRYPCWSSVSLVGLPDGSFFFLDPPVKKLTNSF